MNAFLFRPWLESKPLKFHVNLQSHTESKVCWLRRVTSILPLPHHLDTRNIGQEPLYWIAKLSLQQMIKNCTTSECKEKVRSNHLCWYDFTWFLFCINFRKSLLHIPYMIQMSQIRENRVFFCTKNVFIHFRNSSTWFFIRKGDQRINLHLYLNVDTSCEFDGGCARKSNFSLPYKTSKNSILTVLSKLQHFREFFTKGR